MSTLYSAIERSELLKAARDLIEPSRPPSDDPVLGAPPEIVFRWNTFTKKHGSLVERVMTKVIQHAPGWRPASQTRFKCDTETTKKLIDRIAINQATEVAIFIECKRNLGNVSNPYLRSIRDYDRWCRDKSADIALGSLLPLANGSWCRYRRSRVLFKRSQMERFPIMFMTQLKPN